MNYNMAEFLEIDGYGVYRSYTNYTYHHEVGDEIVIDDSMYKIKSILFNPKIHSITYSMKLIKDSVLW